MVPVNFLLIHLDAKARAFRHSPLRPARDGQRRFEGRLAGVEDGRIVVEIEDKRQEFAFEDIDRARLVPDV